MASRFRVEWADTAATDVTEIIRFIVRYSPLSASKIYQRIRKRADTLRRFPDRAHVVPELEELDVITYRELVVPVQDPV